MREIAWHLLLPASAILLAMKCTMSLQNTRSQTLPLSTQASTKAKSVSVEVALPRHTTSRNHHTRPTSRVS